MLIPQGLSGKYENLFLKQQVQRLKEAGPHLFQVQPLILQLQNMMLKYKLNVLRWKMFIFTTQLHKSQHPFPPRSPTHPLRINEQIQVVDKASQVEPDTLYMLFL